LVRWNGQLRKKFTLEYGTKAERQGRGIAVLLL